jgi:hypothetical protein
VNAVGSVRGPDTASAVPPPGAAAVGDAPLLPSPSTATVPDDPMSWLYLVLSKDQSQTLDEGTTQVAAMKTERQEDLKKLLDAIQQAVQASQDHSFWDSLGDAFGAIAKVAAVVASIAAAVATAGAAAPLAAIAIGGAVLSSASFVDGELHVLQKLGIDPGTAGILDTSMSIGGAIGSVGAGLVSGAGGVASVLSRGSTVVGGLADMAKGGTTIEAGAAQARGDDALADQIRSRNHLDHLQRMIVLLIDATKRSDQQSTEGKQVLAATKTTQNDTMLGITSMKG